jgi:group I intron endonuclease
MNISNFQIGREGRDLMDESYGIIYKVTNSINNKVYVGQTIVGLETRRERHVNDALAKRDNNYFHNAIRKHGKDKFEWKIIGSAESKEKLDDLEIHYIKKLKSFEKGYNLTKGAGGMAGYVITEEHRKNLSESRKGYKHTDEQKRKISEALMGRFVSEHTRKLLSESGKKIIRPKGPANPRYGKAASKKAIDRSVEVISCWWEITFPDGTKKVLKNLSAFCREQGFYKGSLCSVSNGYRSHYKGYKCKKLTGLNNPNRGKKRSEEIKLKMSVAKRGKNSPAAHAVIIGNKYFDTITEAKKFMGITHAAIKKRILHKTKWLDYSYVK